MGMYYSESISQQRLHLGIYIRDGSHASQQESCNLESMSMVVLIHSFALYWVVLLITVSAYLGEQFTD